VRVTRTTFGKNINKTRRPDIWQLKAVKVDEISLWERFFINQLDYNINILTYKLIVISWPVTSQ
jgi:hypothetical protein